MRRGKGSINVSLSAGFFFMTLMQCVALILKERGA